MHDGSREGWMHEALCREAENSALSASNYVKQQEIDILERGLREAKKQIAELQRQLEFRRTTEGAASRTEAKE